MMYRRTYPCAQCGKPVNIKVIRGVATLMCGCGDKVQPEYLLNYDLLRPLTQVERIYLFIQRVK